MDNKSDKLKNRLKIDTICCLITAIVMGLLALINMCYFLSCKETYLDTLSGAAGAFTICLSFVIISLILVEIKKTGKPFTKSIIWKLRILAIWIMFGAFLPDLTTLTAEFILRNTFEIIINTKNLFTCLLGVVIGILSEIFVYGYELQDDVDLIA